MQQELEDVAILGVNESGHEVGNPSMTDGRDLPWLQDVPAEDVWTTWAVAYRDVVIVDPEGRFVEAYNLSEHDLSEEEAYESLKERLAVAGL